jgi:type II secretory pathway pseudopilin PulG
MPYRKLTWHSFGSINFRRNYRQSNTVKFPSYPPTARVGSPCRQRRSDAAFTLAEVVISAAIAAMTVSGIIYGYTQSSKRAEWSGYSLAAQALAVQRLEQTRASRWDPDSAVDQLLAANFAKQTLVLDIPVIGTSFAYATNFTTITDISAVPPLLRMIRVDCAWVFPTTGRVFTNTVATYRSPDR